MPWSRTRRRRVLLSVLLALTAVLALSAPAAHAAAGMELSVEDEDVFLTGTPALGSTAGYAKLAELNASWMRVQIGWSKLLKSDPGATSPPPDAQYDFSGLDSLVNLAASHGIKVEITIAGPAPAWAAGNHRQGPVRPNPTLFGQFVTKVATHFRGRVGRYGIWNEPNFASWVSPLKSAPRIYRGLYTSAYDAIKAADPTASVLLGETSPFAKPGKATSPLDFLRKMACVNPKYKKVGGCAPLQTDGYAHHPYDLFGNPPTRPLKTKDDVTIASLKRLTKALDKLQNKGAISGPRPLGVYLDEFGYLSVGKKIKPKPPNVRAIYLTQAFKIAAANPRVKQLSQYLLVQPPAGFPFNTGILTPSGQDTPMFTSLSAWSKSAVASGAIVAPLAPFVLPPPAPGT